MSEVSEGRKLENLGYENLQKNNIQEAETNFLAALKEMEKEGDDAGQAYVLGNLGSRNTNSFSILSINVYLNFSFINFNIKF